MVFPSTLVEPRTSHCLGNHCITAHPMHPDASHRHQLWGLGCGLRWGSSSTQLHNDSLTAAITTNDSNKLIATITYHNNINQNSSTRTNHNQHQPPPTNQQPQPALAPDPHQRPSWTKRSQSSGRLSSAPLALSHLTRLRRAGSVAVHRFQFSRDNSSQQ